MKNALIAIIIVLSFKQCLAQEKEYRVGIEFGPNLMSVVHFDPVIPDSYFAPQFGYTIGSEFSSVNKQKININLRYSDCQYLYHENENKQDQYLGMTNLSFATISTSMDFFLLKKYIFIRVGAFSNYLLSTTSEHFVLGINDETDYRKRFNYGIVSGIGLSLPLFDKLDGMFLLYNDFWMSSFNRMVSGLPSYYLNESMFSIKLIYSISQEPSKN